MQSLTVLCANIHTLLCKKIATVTRCLKGDITKYFPQNYMFTKCLGRENLEPFFRVVSKNICGHLR